MVRRAAPGAWRLEQSRPQAVQDLILNPLQWDRNGRARKDGLIQSEGMPQRLSKLVIHCMLRLMAR
jgi:hypothetical protein